MIIDWSDENSVYAAPHFMVLMHVNVSAKCVCAINREKKRVKKEEKEESEKKHNNRFGSECGELCNEGKCFNDI